MVSLDTVQTAMHTVGPTMRPRRFVRTMDIDYVHCRKCCGTESRMERAVNLIGVIIGSLMNVAVEYLYRFHRESIVAINIMS